MSEFHKKEKSIIWTITDFAGNHPETIYSESLGVKVPEACYRSGMFSYDSTRLIGESYLLNAKRSSLEIDMPLGVFNYGTSMSAKGVLSNRNLKEKDIAEHYKTIQLQLSLLFFKTLFVFLVYQANL